LLVYEYRYPDDPFDNYWFPITPNSSLYVQSSAQVEALNATGVRMNQTFPPPAVMNTALTTNGNMTIYMAFHGSNSWLRLFLAELNSSATITREFYVEVISPILQLVDLLTYENASEVVQLEYYGTVPDSVSLFTDQTSATPWGPLVNAMEIFEVSESRMAILTNQQDSKSSTKSQNANFTLNPDNCSN